jgi:hypothetical protein
VEQVKGVGGGAAEGILVKHLFGQGTDEGLAVQFTVVLFLGALDNVGNVKGSFSG